CFSSTNFEQTDSFHVPSYLAAGITSYLGGRYEGDDVVEDVPFFYPIIGTIRYNLLKNLCNEVIQRARTQS
ncbi:MAG: hypothetical protein IKX39_05295, partial [Muribaculaceae bacterium]|nr:hypothetical protein [Muribaculaceae bacterium]